ncbi:MAG: cysteine desulfurase NifS [Candidatus Methanoplasma sp.]|jgi:cysteine desulfurase|nr:cysteine desulfurase NifS [Candidatus Methanoplasma sp.]
MNIKRTYGTNMPKTIYLDNAATTAVKREVFDAMAPYFTEQYGNPSSIHEFGARCGVACDEARAKVAKVIGANPQEIYFTSGGTESDNWAIKSTAYAKKEKGRHIITTRIEHHAVMETCEFLKRDGFDVTFLDVDDQGLVDPAKLEAAIRPDTILISVIYANNEIGTVQPIAEIGRIARARGVLFHTDAVQAFGHVPIDVDAENIDLLSASGHKIHGPKGIGFLYMRKGVKLPPLMHGGHHERGRRAGTLNVPGIVGLGKAAEIAGAEMAANAERVTALRDRLIKGMLSEIPHSRLNGHPTKRLPGNANLSFRFVEGESLLMMVDEKGVSASTGSACASGSLDPSHVLLAIGLPHEIAHGSLRFSLSEDNTEEEIDYAVEAVREVVERLRSMSPLYEDAVKAGGA